MGEKKLKILFYNTDLRGGGAEKILINIANDLVLKGHDITVGTFFKEGIYRADLHPKIKQYWRFKKPFKGYSKLVLFLSPKYLYKKLIPNDNFDVVIAFLEGFPSRIISGAPHQQKKISWIHLELYPKTITKEFRNKAEAEICYSSFNCIIHVAETVKSCFKRCLPTLENTQRVVYNPLQIQDITEKGNHVSPYSDFEGFTFVTVGRLNPQKAYDRLLRIVKNLQTINQNFRLFILGMGPMEHDLKKFVSENALEKCVFFEGFQRNPYPYIRHADAFICSSIREGYSTVVTEAVILHTPIITTLCSGMEEILGSGDACAGIITENTEEALEKAIRNILQQTENLKNLQVKTVNRAQQLASRDSFAEVENLLYDLHNKF